MAEIMVRRPLRHPCLPAVRRVLRWCEYDSLMRSLNGSRIAYAEYGRAAGE